MDKESKAVAGILADASRRGKYAQLLITPSTTGRKLGLSDIVALYNFYLAMYLGHGYLASQRGGIRKLAFQLVEVAIQIDFC